ncbi:MULTISPECIES: glycoside hydrolase family 43 protein [Enterococcus]|uniref:glycoside hydrolase family 43 protein n=1 Tax=Enterococcus TaxID=1350 RepID=UPI0010FA2657|nr:MULTISPECIES: glycoside hydrolase family 43 protein [Enterococcus]KAF1303951.1 beta-xylosidase [Enterococcus sp. JM9B]
MITNPILTGFNPDPSICRVEEDYYIATSTFEWFPGVMIYHSKDLKNWKLVSTPVNRVSQLNMLGNPDSGGVWAPDLSYHDGKFWLIYSDVKEVQGNNWKDVSNYLITCETIDGDWSEPIYMNGSGFDPSLFHDEDGKKYFVNMVWDYRVYHHSFYGIVLQEYDHEQKKLVGEAKVIFKGTDRKLTEAPHLYKIDNYYYLLTAEGGTKYEHASTIARSKSIVGPFEVHPENPLISSWGYPHLNLQKAGHGSIVHTHTDEWYFVHLTGRPLKRPETPLLENRGYCPLGRETAIQKMFWKDEWPYIVGGNFPQDEVESPNISEVKWPEEASRIDFNEEKLPLDFQTLRIPFSEEIGSLTERSGFLRLYGRESFNSLFYKSLVARRWQHFSFEAVTKVEFSPTSFLQLAGMTNYYNTKNWSSIHITHHEEYGRIIDIMDSDNGRITMPLYKKEIVIPENVNAVFFKTIVNFNTYQYAYSFDEKEWVVIDYLFDSLKLSDDYVVETQEGFFTGAFIGMFAIDTSGFRAVADFDFFEYKEK